MRRAIVRMALLCVLAVAGGCGSDVTTPTEARSATTESVQSDVAEEPPARPAVPEEAPFSGAAGTTGDLPALPQGPTDLRAVLDAATFSWSDEQPEEPGVLLFDVHNTTDGLLRLRLSYDLGSACSEHGRHLLPRVSLEAGASVTRPLRWEQDHGEVAVATQLRLFAAVRYPEALPEELVLTRMVGGGELEMAP